MVIGIIEKNIRETYRERDYGCRLGADSGINLPRPMASEGNSKIGAVQFVWDQRCVRQRYREATFVVGLFNVRFLCRRKENSCKK